MKRTINRNRPQGELQTQKPQGPKKLKPAPDSALRNSGPKSGTDAKLKGSGIMKADLFDLPTLKKSNSEEPANGIRKSQSEAPLRQSVPQTVDLKNSVPEPKIKANGDTKKSEVPLKRSISEDAKAPLSETKPRAPSKAAPKKSTKSPASSESKSKKPKKEESYTSSSEEAPKPKAKPKAAPTKAAPKKADLKSSDPKPKTNAKLIKSESTEKPELKQSDDSQADDKKRKSTGDSKATPPAKKKKVGEGPQYQPITSNINTEFKRKIKKSDLSVCHCCPFTGDCGDSCVNRTLQIECSVAVCPCREKCTNRRFQKREYPALELIEAGDKGNGLRTKVDIKKGSFIIEYVGEIIDIADCAERMANQRHFYFLTIDAKLGIDASRKGNQARFINHSCEPNCETQKWMVLNQTRIGIFAKRDISAGTELTFDYQFERLGSGKQKCLCGTPSCRGYLGAKQQPTVVKKARPPKQLFSNHKKHILTITKRVEATRIDEHIEEVASARIADRAEGEPPIFLRRNVRIQKAAQLRLLHSFMDETYRAQQAELEVHEEKARKKRESAFMLGIDIEKLCRQGQIDYANVGITPRLNRSGQAPEGPKKPKRKAPAKKNAKNGNVEPATDSPTIETQTTPEEQDTEMKEEVKEEVKQEMKQEVIQLEQSEVKHEIIEEVVAAVALTGVVIFDEPLKQEEKLVETDIVMKEDDDELHDVQINEDKEPDSEGEEVLIREDKEEVPEEEESVEEAPKPPKKKTVRRKPIKRGRY